jgi:hypothetical protein
MENDQERRGPKKLWEAPKLSYMGDVEDVVQGGIGKVSVTNSDPGEPRKTRPSEP